MDVDEFFNLLMDRLETQLKDTKDSQLITNTFRGVLVNEVIGRDCQHVSESEEPFNVIQLPVKNNKNVQ